MPKGGTWEEQRTAPNKQMKPLPVCCCVRTKEWEETKQQNNLLQIPFCGTPREREQLARDKSKAEKMEVPILSIAERLACAATRKLPYLSTNLLYLERASLIKQFLTLCAPTRLKLSFRTPVFPPRVACRNSVICKPAIWDASEWESFMLEVQSPIPNNKLVHQNSNMLLHSLFAFYIFFFLLHRTFA